jgi:hypothetical protein
MARRIRPARLLRPLHLFICEDAKSSKYYMEGLGRSKNVNIKAENCYGTSPENVLRAAEEKRALFPDEGTATIYCLFDKDDCEDAKFKKVVSACREKGLVPAISVPCYEYWLLLHLRKTDKAFQDARECCEDFKNAYNKEFQTNFNIKQLKSRKEIFEDLKDRLQTAVQNAESLNLDENGSPYTNIHEVIKNIIEE